MSLSTHVLDISRGKPAAGIAVRVDRAGPEDVWTMLADGVTDADGRIATLLPPHLELTAGSYRLTFDTAAYFRGLGLPLFYPQVIVHFALETGGGKYHLPLLLSPFGYSTYRGS